MAQTSLTKDIVRTLGAATEINFATSVRAVIRMGTAPMVRGYVLSTRRLRDAVDRSHVNDIYAALFEATNWLDSLSERDGGLNSRGEVQAIKFLRNRTHHQWASAVRHHDGEWRWRPLDDLPVPEDPKHQNAKLEPLYTHHLEGKTVTDAFDAFEAAVIVLAPDVDLT